LGWDSLNGTATGWKTQAQISPLIDINWLLGLIYRHTQQNTNLDVEATI